MKFIIYIAIALFIFLWLFSCNRYVNEPASKNYGFNWNKSKISFNSRQEFPIRSRREVACDVKSFEIIKGFWAKDKNHIFYKGRAHKEIDRETFYLDENDMPKDKENVYTTSWENGSGKMMVWENADPKTFRTIPLADGYKPDLWGKDGTHFFYMLKPIDCDYDSFEIVDATYSKDKNAVYYGSRAIQGADPTMFHYDPEMKSYRDKNNVYLQGKIK